MIKPLPLWIVIKRLRIIFLWICQLTNTPAFLHCWAPPCIRPPSVLWQVSGRPSLVEDCGAPPGPARQSHPPPPVSPVNYDDGDPLGPNRVGLEQMDAQWVLCFDELQAASERQRASLFLPFRTSKHGNHGQDLSIIDFEQTRFECCLLADCPIPETHGSFSNSSGARSRSLKHAIASYVPHSSSSEADSLPLRHSLTHSFSRKFRK